MSAPPRCAKWATLSLGEFCMPKYNSIAAYPMTKYFAFIGMGGKSYINSVLGNKKPKPTSKPNMSPDAPTMGVLYNAFNLPKVGSI